MGSRWDECGGLRWCGGGWLCWCCCGCSWRCFGGFCFEGWVYYEEVVGGGGGDRVGVDCWCFFGGEGGDVFLRIDGGVGGEV